MDAACLQPPRRIRVPIDNRWGGGEMAALDFGDPARPPDLVFAHANGFNAATYRSLLAPLGASLRIIAPDLRGHGATRLPAQPRGRRSWRDHRDDLVGLIDAFDGPPVVLAGHSMGAVTALLAADRRPDRVSSLVLFEPVILPRLASAMLSWPVAGRMARRYPLVRAALKRRTRFDSRQAAMDAYRGRGAFKGWPEVMLADYVAEGFADVDGGVELICSPAWEASNYAAQGHDPWPVLRRLKQPVRILKAQFGSTCSLGPGVIPGVEVRVAPGGTHFFPMLQPDLARDALFEAAV